MADSSSTTEMMQLHADSKLQNTKELNTINLDEESKYQRDSTQKIHEHAKKDMKIETKNQYDCICGQPLKLTEVSGLCAQCGVQKSNCWECTQQNKFHPKGLNICKMCIQKYDQNRFMCNHDCPRKLRLKPCRNVEYFFCSRCRCKINVEQDLIWCCVMCKNDLIFSGKSQREKYICFCCICSKPHKEDDDTKNNYQNYDELLGNEQFAWLSSVFEKNWHLSSWETVKKQFNETSKLQLNQDQQMLLELLSEVFQSKHIGLPECKKIKGKKDEFVDKICRIIEVYCKAIELFPQRAILYFYRAEAYSLKNEHEKAVNDINFYLKKNPECARGRDQKMHILSKENDEMNSNIEFEESWSGFGVIIIIITTFMFITNFVVLMLCCLVQFICCLLGIVVWISKTRRKSFNQFLIKYNP
eukprot:255425_1